MLPHTDARVALGSLPTTQVELIEGVGPPPAARGSGPAARAAAPVSGHTRKSLAACSGPATLLRPCAGLFSRPLRSSFAFASPAGAAEPRIAAGVSAGGHRRLRADARRGRGQALQRPRVHRRQAALDARRGPQVRGQRRASSASSTTSTRPPGAPTTPASTPHTATGRRAALHDLRREEGRRLRGQGREHGQEERARRARRHRAAQDRQGRLPDGRTIDAAALATRRSAPTLGDPPANRILAPKLKVVRPKVTTAGLAKAYGTIVTIDRGNFKLRLFKGLKLSKTYGVAVGMPGLPDADRPLHDRQQGRQPGLDGAQQRRGPAPTPTRPSRAARPRTR